MKIRKGAIFLIETPDGIQSSIVQRTHSLRDLVIIGGTGMDNGSMLILQKEQHYKKKPIYIYMKADDLFDI